jgi:2-methylcitrate dehydratase PrpD
VISQRIAEFVCSTDFENIPNNTVSLAKRTMLDCIGVALAGLNDPNSLIVREFVLETAGRPESTVLGSRTKVPAVNAALANGVACHVLDYDDVSYVMTGHPSAISCPATLAMAELQSSSGKETIAAYVIGTEVACRLGAALTDAQYERGWHNTGTMGTFGATAAAGKLLQLDREQMQNAIGVAGSMIAGIKQNFGTSCKPYHAGQAASNGVKAALLAKKGFTSSPNVFEGKNGLVQLLSGSLKDEQIDMLGKPYAIDEPGFSIKVYPSCAFTHSAIDCVLKLRKEHNIQPMEVVKINCGTAQGVIDTVQYGIAETPNQGKFSMPFCLSLALLDGEVGLRQFTIEKCKDAKVRELESKVGLHCDEELNSIRYTYNGAKVEIVLANGKKLFAETKSPRGEPAQTLSDEQVSEKFAQCASFVFGAETIDNVEKKILGIENLSEIGELTGLLAE